MMKALAELAMRGRLQAAFFAFLGAALPMFSWFAAAIVTLVTLRRGSRDGALILLAALTAAFVVGERVEVITVSAVLVAYISANVLRMTVNLSYSLLSAVFASALFLTGLITQSEGLLDSLKQVLEAQLGQLDLGEAAGIDGQDFVHLLSVQTISYGIGFTAITGLLVGRWWQAMLYNPGGFQKEFHALRLSPAITIVLFLLSIVGLGGAELLGVAESDVFAGNTNVNMINVAAIASIMTVPLLITGAAIVHSIVKTKHASKHWLVGFYITLPITNTMVYLMVVMDGFIDIRNRVSKPSDT